ncbi:hypothetical protein AG1IA_01041 [Rhizoctonia solani AG-1 IA]|uniref:Uncharacterized protein n=1 Tax=Thanatephorus cucumeris (strain AG1-IA) TaxID=983506 RepID=L8X3Z5_THACA|nr:hypothetical protein AG1IA_01041 [Rhizoctonia solani AG-1 IA]
MRKRRKISSLRGKVGGTKMSVIIQVRVLHTVIYCISKTTGNQFPDRNPKTKETRCGPKPVEVHRFGLVYRVCERRLMGTRSRSVVTRLRHTARNARSRTLTLIFVSPTFPFSTP